MSGGFWKALNSTNVPRALHTVIVSRHKPWRRVDVFTFTLTLTFQLTTTAVFVRDGGLLRLFIKYNKAYFHKLSSSKTTVRLEDFSPIFYTLNALRARPPPNRTRKRFYTPNCTAFSHFGMNFVSIEP